MHTFFIFLILIASSLAEAQVNRCLEISKTAKGLKAGSNPKTYEIFYPGEKLGLIGRTRDGKFVKVDLAGELYWLKEPSFQKVSSCKLKICVDLNEGDTVYTKPSMNAPVGLDEGGVFSVISNAKSWYRVRVGSGYRWLPGSAVKSSKTSCEGSSELDDIASSIDGESSAHEDVTNGDTTGKSKWLFGFEGGYIVTASSRPLKNLLTPIPDPATNVNGDSSAISPYIESVSNGTGWYAGVTMETPFIWGLQNRLALGYKTRTLEYVERQNPYNSSVSFITYNDLKPSTVSKTFSFVYISDTIKLAGWHFLGMQWQPGINLGIDYSLDTFQVEFRTGPQKLTRYYVDSGYEKINFLYGPRLDLQFWMLNFSVMGNMSSFGFEPAASLGVQF
ncbi:MAG: hypothetical protein H6623_07495 [Bdellovibrionaceae bacterium]|nr:hypothetical protein [Pseudobdellovibrionaceae bacterium]